MPVRFVRVRGDRRRPGRATTGGAFVWAILYQRHPNLWPSGISHGVLGSLAYVLLLDTNPLSRL